VKAPETNFINSTFPNIMAPRIFVTGASGYIGGHFVDRLSQSHPEYHVVVLVRDKAQGEQITTKFPNFETVLGDLDSHDVLLKEASKADVILRKSLCHLPISIVRVNKTRACIVRPRSWRQISHRRCKHTARRPRLFHSHWRNSTFSKHFRGH
jgi:hypothetical protein